MGLVYDSQDGPRSWISHIMNFKASTCYVMVEKRHDRATKEIQLKEGSLWEAMSRRSRKTNPLHMT